MLTIIKKTKLKDIKKQLLELQEQLDHANKDIIKLQSENRRLHKRLIKKRNYIEYGITE